MSWWDSGDDDEPEFDEADVRVRPNPKGNRPRTKVRPEHKQAVSGWVLAVDRGRYTVLVGGGESDASHRARPAASDAAAPRGVRPAAGRAGGAEREITATTARELGRKSVVNGDRVELVGDTSGAAGSLARIVRVQERTSLLRRSADDTDAVERILVANADQMLIVVAAANPEPRTRLVDRYLVAAYDAGISPLLCITKCDLADPEPFLANFVGLDLPVFRSAADEMPLDEIREHLEGSRTVLVGHSGVGKSTLVNALVPTADRATGVVNAVTGRGRHTSSSTVALRVPGLDGWVFDTPGVRSFGLGHVNPENVLRSFGDLEQVAEDCPRGCTHLPDAPDCALNEAAEADMLGTSGRARLDSLQRMLTTFAAASPTYD